MKLRAGRLELELEGADVRYLCDGGVELVRRIYVAVRDDDWGTVPYVCSPLELDRGPDRFRARFACTAAGAIAIDWTVTVEGLPTGGLRYSIQGEALSAFTYNRIGICVLHPPATTAGARYRATHSDGRLPLRIGPQPVANGMAKALFEPFQELEIDLGSAGQLKFTFRGDEFEIEDQRNWTDASFKTYSTPLALGLPHRAASGQRFEQTVEVALAKAPEAPAARRSAGLSIALGRPDTARMPALGLALTRALPASDERERALLAALRPRHLRYDLPLGDVGAPGQRLAEACGAAESVGALLELALVVGDDANAELAGVARALAPHQDRLVRVLVLPSDPQRAATSPALARAARAHLAPALPGVPLVAGTALDFAEVNRDVSLLGRLDGIAYSIDPQAHATDDRSLIETLEIQAETVESARALCGDQPVIVGPVSLGPRRAAEADPRHASLFGAAWTVGSLHRLAQGGADAVTLFETTGSRGVVSVDRVPPLYHVLHAVGEWGEALLVPAEVSDALALEALALSHSGGLSLLVANLQAHAVCVRVGPLPAGEISLCVLSDRDGFVRDREWRNTGSEELCVDLPPHATARIDVK